MNKHGASQITFFELNSKYNTKSYGLLRCFNEPLSYKPVIFMKGKVRIRDVGNQTHLTRLPVKRPSNLSSINKKNMK